MRRLNILIVDPFLVRGGGNETTQSLIMRFTDRTKFRLILAVPVASDFTKRVGEWDVDCVVVSPPPRLLRYDGEILRDGPRGRARSFLDTFRYNLRLLALVRARKIDVIYSSCLRAYLYVGLAAKLARRPVLLYINGELTNPFLDRLAFRGADRIVFNGRANRDAEYPALIRRLHRKVHVVPNALDLDRVAEVETGDRSTIAQALALDSERVNIAYLGFLYPGKGVHYLLHALARVRQHEAGFRLYVIGDCPTANHEPYKQELRDIVRREGLQDHVVFVGWRSDALEVLSLMDMLVHPSLSEGFPRAVLEAMALGKAVVATRVGALTADDVIRDGQGGFLVEPRDTEALASRIRTLITDGALRRRMGETAREKAFAEYRIQDRLRQLESIWSEMAGASS